MDEHTEAQASSGSNKMMMVLTTVIVLLLLGGGAYYFMNQKTAMTPSSTTPKVMTPTNTMKMEETSAPSQAAKNTSPSAAMPSGAAVSGKVVEVAVSGKSFSFTPNVIKVKKGDTVKVTFSNTGGFHDFVIDELNVRTKQVNTGGTDTVQFVADKAGTFEFYCSVGNHRQMGMKGNLIVE